MIRFVLLLALSTLSSGCSWISDYIGGSDNSLPPAELVDISDPIAVQKLWDARVGSGTGGAFIKLRPVLAQGRIYAAGHDGEVLALEADSGRVLWKMDTELTITAGVGLGENLVLVGTNKGDVLALSRDDGGEVWRAQVSSEVLAAPQAADGVVVVRTGDGNFVGLDSRSGERRWLYTYKVPVLTLRGTSAPLLAQGLAISGLDTGKLLVLSLSNGAPVWEKTIAPPRGRTELERMVDIDSEPKVAGSNLYASAYQGNITAIDLSSGNTVWTRDFSSHAGLEVDRDRVYVVDERDSVWALDRRSGDSLWKQERLTGRALSGPVVIGNYVVVGDFQGYLHWLTREDGRIVGRVRMDRRGIGAAPIADDDTLYVLGKGGNLSAFRTGAS